ncbi:MAG: Protocatechuate 3,4-dioxygenase beta chain [uncultured Thermomicrobiales bacterium]|uniref:Protocatechuate 3,4-dioxygenase beta chain n=1 Tax=uncultured Thermomicrobiales bacterium TaxID=1645740 RepID=A0A6J4VI17_9BACT|nr:MAG: Protocatechuate 3,4-dioxygenase beta chain [uncultured Thermomicrobiales bacterium]
MTYPVNVPDRARLSRRTLAALATALAAPAALRSAPIAAQADPTAAAPFLPPTPECDDDDSDPTLAQTEGPFFTPDAPERTDLREPGLPGEPLSLAGFVLDDACRPVPGALLEFWQADAAGVYDNEGFTLRGHQFSDEEGRWALETVVPGLYPGRTRHIHVRAQAPAGLLLTTQLYFPDESANAADGIFDPALLVEWEETPSGEPLRARFDFVVEGAA